MDRILYQVYSQRSPIIYSDFEVLDWNSLLFCNQHSTLHFQPHLKEAEIWSPLESIFSK